MTIRRTCPHCGAEQAIRSHRRPLERLLLFFKPYRCAGCNRRFFSRLSEGRT